LESGTFGITDIRNNQDVQTYDKVHFGPITSLQIHPSGLFALTTSIDKRIRTWDLIDHRKMSTIRAHTEPILDGQWNRDGSQFLTCDRGGTLLHWQANCDKFIKSEGECGSNAVKSESSTRIDGEITQNLSVEMIESRLDRMLKQLETIGETMVLMNQRTKRLEGRLAVVQRGRPTRCNP
jgi:WD40 repeat protein